MKRNLHASFNAPGANRVLEKCERANIKKIYVKCLCGAIPHAMASLFFALDERQAFTVTEHKQPYGQTYVMQGDRGICAMRPQGATTKHAVGS